MYYTMEDAFKVARADEKNKKFSDEEIKNILSDVDDNDIDEFIDEFCEIYEFMNLDLLEYVEETKKIFEENKRRKNNEKNN